MAETQVRTVSLNSPTNKATDPIAFLLDRRHDETDGAMGMGAGSEESK